MKKLMIAAAIVCVAAFAQAATFNWEFGLYAEDIEATPVQGSIKLFCDGSLVDTIAIEDGSASASIEDTNFGTYTAEITIDNFANGSGTKSGWSYTIDAFPLPGCADPEGSLAMVCDDLSVFVSNNYELDLTKSAAANGYTAAPEPTSGLLLLLGVAGMALRRRRA